MPIVKISEAHSRAAYDAVTSTLDLAADRPAGLILHAASETPTGAVAIVDVWESAELAGAFERERLFPVFEAKGLMDGIAAGPQPETYEPFDYVS